MSEIVNPTPEFNEECVVVLRGWRTGDLPFNEAVARLSVLVQRAATDGIAINQARAEQVLAHIQLTRGNLEATIQHCQRARVLISKYYNPERKAVIDITEGEGWRFLGEFDKAIAFYQSAHDHAEQVQDKTMQTYTVVNTGLAYLSLGRVEEAEKAFLEGLTLCEHWKESEAVLGPLCEIYHGLATIRLSQNRPQDAWEQAYTAYKVVQGSTDQRYHGMVNRTMGEVVTALDVMPDPTFSDNPDDYFRASVSYFNELNAEAEVFRTTFSHALSLAKRGKHNSALRKLQQVIIAFERLGMADDLQNALTARKNLLA